VKSAIACAEPPAWFASISPVLATSIPGGTLDNGVPYYIDTAERGLAQLHTLRQNNPPEKKKKKWEGDGIVEEESNGPS